MESKKEPEKNEEEEEYHEIITDPNEIKLLEEFKHSLETVTDKSDSEVIDPCAILDNDILIHFLRAKKLNVQKATRMILNYFHWKRKINLDDLYINFKLEHKNEIQLIFPHCFHKYAKDGSPIYIQIMGKLNPDEVFKIDTPQNICIYSALISERMEREYFKMCAKIKKRYVHGVFNIVDFRDIRTTMLINKKLLTYLKESFGILQDCYPECLSGCYILNAGFAFRAFFSAVSLFLDAKTKDKVRVYGENYREHLLEKIDSDCLPSFFGGTCQCPNKGGCLFSNAGPWQTEEDKKDDNLPEEIINGRIELNNYMMSGIKVNTVKEEKKEKEKLEEKEEKVEKKEKVEEKENVEKKEIEVKNTGNEESKPENV